jgi:hypothetical protein
VSLEVVGVTHGESPYWTYFYCEGFNGVATV